MPLRIQGLIWDDWNVDHIARHGVRAEEVEQVCFNEETQFTRAGGENG